LPHRRRLFCLTAGGDDAQSDNHSRIGAWLNGLRQSAAAKTCERRGGACQIDGGLNRDACIISYSDAGKPCTVMADCQGDCLATPGQRMGAKAPENAPPPTACQATERQ
jgi:hypothetical protein